MRPNAIVSLLLAGLLAFLPSVVADDPATLAEDTWEDPTVDVARPLLCTPDDGNDYWIDHCTSWETSTETVTYVEDTGGDDPWCVLYPVPCAPSPADPIQLEATTAHLSRPVVAAGVDQENLCDDIGCDPLCGMLPGVCASIGFADLHIDGPLALADVDGDGRTDGVALHDGGTWYYAGVCDDLTLSISCYTTGPTPVFTPTGPLNLCTPTGEDYWLEHCNSYSSHAFVAEMRSTSVAWHDVCVIYPAPCVSTPEATLESDTVTGDVWTFKHEGEPDTGEAKDDVCQVNDIPCMMSIEISQHIASYIMPVGSVDWTAVTAAGLADADGDGWADGLAVSYVPAWADTGLVEIQWLATMVVIPWEYQPFPCMQVHPETLAMKPDRSCTSTIVVGPIL